MRRTNSSVAASVDDLEFQADLSLQRLLPRLQDHWELLGTCESDRAEFENRLHAEWPRLFGLLIRLYGGRYDFFFHLERILHTAATAFHDRPKRLREIDERRQHQPDWFESQAMVGGALYVDLFSENLGKLRESIDYFGNLGLSYLHLMPLFAVRPGNNDGGYAISNYRSINPDLGSIEDLTALAEDLHRAGINLVLDFVFNHTADDHHWAMKAQAGEREFQEYYYLFPDRKEPDEYERTLREIFPTVRRGNFTWHDGMSKWVWTTFNSFQWDLNYQNPAVFNAMLEEMFFLANTGVDILRLDAVAFIWKEKGTCCENLAEAHVLIQAFNCLARISTPGLIFKSEAIVHPDDVVTYVSSEECQLSYNPTLMALLWESLATRRVDLLAKSLSYRHQLPEGTAWVNYLRCHDDIGWTFDDKDAAEIGINAYDHRQFLNRFYTGQFQGSFARGIPFQENHETGDMRIAGTLASLAGLELALELGDDHEIELAKRRILLLQGVVLSIGGIPLLYLGEEWGLLNDYDFVRDPAKSSDTRWVHRPKMDWDLVGAVQPVPADAIASTASLALTTEERKGPHTEIYSALRKIIALRKELPALAGQEMKLVATNNPHILSYVRQREGHRLVVLANFSEHESQIEGNLLRTAGMGRFFADEITGKQFSTASVIHLEPYQILWLSRQ